MSKSVKPKRPAKKARKPHYHLRLYIVGKGLNSRQAQTNLIRICEEFLKGRYTIETVDVLNNVEAAVRDNILITPTLVFVSPRPRVTVLGNLNDRQNL